MKTFGFKKIEKKHNKLLKKLYNINILFIFSLIISFSFINSINNIWKIVLAEKTENILKKDLKELAIYLWYIEKDLPNVIFSFDTLKNNFINWDNILQKNKADIVYVWEYIKNNKNKLLNLWMKDFEYIINMIWKLWDYKEDIFSLLWEQQPQQYLVILQNMSEKRPNWWFFWSFWILKISPNSFDFKVMDSYYPNFLKPDIYLKWPEWTKSFLDDNSIYFVSANKFGFTDIDGGNIKKLYESIFDWEKLRWIIFVRSDMFEKILPWFTEKIWERQFTNASIDLIRWENRPWKKELYIKDINDYIEKNKDIIFHNFINNIENIIENNYINMYLNDISDWFQKFIEDNHLINKYNPDNIYLWDSNISFNKIDQFVKKNSQIEDLSWNIILNTDKNIIDISKLNKWDYRLNTTYDMNIPSRYKDFISSLENKNNITLTDREKYILWLTEFWDNRWIIYLPTNFDIIWYNWEYYNNKIFDTPFSKNFLYKIKSDKNNSTKSLEIKFRIN